MSSARIVCTKGHAEREIVTQVATPRGNCVGGLILSVGSAEAHSHMRAREDDACSRSTHGHGMGVYEEMRVHSVQACTHLSMLALVQPVADFHRLTRRETRERWRHHGSTDTVCTIGLRTWAVCVCVCVCVRAEPSREPRGLQCHVTRSERHSQLSCTAEWDSLCSVLPTPVGLLVALVFTNGMGVARCAGQSLLPQPRVLERLTWHCTLCTGGPKVFGGGRHAPRAANVA
jgi:hypothetical protein